MPVTPCPPPRQARQRGLVLVLALVVLAALSLAAVGLMRGVVASNRVAGNLAFQQGAVQAADAGIERAVAWLEQQSAATLPAPSAAAEIAAGKPAPPPVPSTRLDNHLPRDGDTMDTMRYMATRGDPNFSLGQTWESYWQSLVTDNRVNDLPRDANGNQVSFAIQRLCSATGPARSARCEASPARTGGEGNSNSNSIGLNTPSAVYYRITVRVQGPRNATSFIQAVVAI
ncbi:MAG: PilX N-terminal domain-containing pilus assembly protein [Roseateles sp.]|uniref:pilus assembly PilX family protein n=1 Tax=Roseateles sp. TaxID=1971397 RepID=UPI0039E7F935